VCAGGEGETTEREGYGRYYTCSPKYAYRHLFPVLTNVHRISPYRLRVAYGKNHVWLKLGKLLLCIERNVLDNSVHGPGISVVAGR